MRQCWECVGKNKAQQASNCLLRVSYDNGECNETTYSVCNY